jgi:hypothetical protein
MSDLTFNDAVIIAIVILIGGWLQFHGYGGGGRYMDAMHDMYDND